MPTKTTKMESMPNTIAPYHLVLNVKVPSDGLQDYKSHEYEKLYITRRRGALPLRDL